MLNWLAVLFSLKKTRRRAGDARRRNGGAEELPGQEEVEERPCQEETR